MFHIENLDLKTVYEYNLLFIVLTYLPDDRASVKLNFGIEV